MKAWAIFLPSGRLACIHNGYMVYRTKREALMDCEEGCTVRRVTIREGK